MAAASKDGIESVHVKLAQIPPIYRAGEDLTGRIIVVCGATTPIKAVKVYLIKYFLILNSLLTIHTCTQGYGKWTIKENDI